MNDIKMDHTIINLVVYVRLIFLAKIVHYRVTLPLTRDTKIVDTLYSTRILQLPTRLIFDGEVDYANLPHLDDVKGELF